MLRRHFLLLAAAGLAPAAFAGPRPAAAQQNQAGSFAGTVTGSNAFIGIVTYGSQVLAYVCDGTDQGATIWGWFDGPLAGPQTQLASTNGLGLLLDLSGPTPRGQVLTRDGSRLDFQTEVAS